MQQDLRRTGTVGEGSYVPPTLQLEDGNRRRQLDYLQVKKKPENTEALKLFSDLVFIFQFRRRLLITSLRIFFHLLVIERLLKHRLRKVVDFTVLQQITSCGSYKVLNHV